MLNTRKNQSDPQVHFPSDFKRQFRLHIRLAQFFHSFLDILVCSWWKLGPEKADFFSEISSITVEWSQIEDRNSDFIEIWIFDITFMKSAKSCFWKPKIKILKKNEKNEKWREDSYVLHLFWILPKEMQMKYFFWAETKTLPEVSKTALQPELTDLLLAQILRVQRILKNFDSSKLSNFDFSVLAHDKK